MGKIFRIFLFALLTAVSAGAQTLPRPTGWVTDEAQVLPPYVENSLVQKIQSYKDSTDIEIAVVTVKSLQGYEVEEFANRLFNGWGVGVRGKDNGVMLLLAPSERRVRIEVGYGLEGDLTDNQSGYILDQNAVPYFRDNNWSGGVTATVDALLSHLGSRTYQVRLAEKVERERSAEVARVAEENRRREVEAVRRREQAEFNAAIGTFLFFAAPVAILIALAVLAYLWIKRRKRLKKTQEENFQMITEATGKFDDLELRIAEAESVFKSLEDVNIDSVRDSYSKVLGDIRVFQSVSLMEVIPSIWDAHSNYRQAETVRQKVSVFVKGITDVEAKARQIISLPEMIESKKQYATAQREGAAHHKVENARAQFESVRSRLNEEYDGKISTLLEKSSANVDEGLKLFLRFQDKRLDWIYLSNLFTEAESNVDQVSNLLNQYFELVTRAKANKDNLVLDLEMICKSGAETVNHSDVKESTVQDWTASVIEANVVGKIAPDKDQEWVLFLAKAISSKKKLEEVIDQAKKDVRNAEEKRERARRQAEESRQAAIRASQRRSSNAGGGFRSGGSRSGGFGGGRSGGGGASRGF